MDDDTSQDFDASGEPEQEDTKQKGKDRGDEKQTPPEPGGGKPKGT